MLRKADGYETEGLSGVASRLRREAELLDAPQPVAGVLAPAELLVCAAQAPALPPPQPAPNPGGRKGR